MILLCDVSMLIHSFFHVGANPNTESPDDPYDVAERVMRKGDDLRKWLRSKEQFKDMEFVAVFDQPHPRKLFRCELMPSYKSGRTSHETLHEAEAATLAAYKQSSDWHTVAATYGLECDDFIASIAAQYDGQVIIYSQDRDYHQCLEDKRVMILKKCNKEMDVGFVPEWFSTKDLVEKHGLAPEQWSLYQAMLGGKDSVMGWGGCGPKKASEVLSLDNVRVDLLDQDERVKMNKTQRASYPEFSNQFERIMFVRALKRDVPAGDFLKSIRKESDAILTDSK